MPHKRIEFPGAVYDVISRGDHGEAIYQEDEDRRLFLQFLGEVCERTGWLIHAFVNWMVLNPRYCPRLFHLRHRKFKDG